MNYAEEIRELHQFFQDYFSGALPAEAISRFVETLADDFALVDASGRTTTRETIVDVIRGLHGHRPEVKIWIEQPQLRYDLGDVLVATYEEWQTDAGRTTQRWSTVVLERADGLPNGLRWLHVHESGLHTVEDA